MEFIYLVSERETTDRVRNLLGVPESFLPNETILCYDVLDTSKNHVINTLKEFEGEVTEELSKRIESAIIVYSAYLLCDDSMLLRIPIRMESIDSKTQLQQVDWDKLADKLLGRVNSMLNDLLKDMGLSEIVYGITISSLTNVTPYPNQSI